MRTLTLTLLLVLVSFSLLADTIALQSFENSANDTWNYTADPAGMNRLVWWGRSDQPMGGASAQSGSWYWASWDLDNSAHSLTFDNVSLPLGYIHSLSFWYYTNGLDQETDLFRFCVEYDNGIEWTNWVNLELDTDAWTQMTIDIPQQASTVRIKFAAEYDGFTKYAHWDNISITNTPAPPTAPLVYNLSVVQRTDGSKLVDISYDLFDANGDSCDISLMLSTNSGVTFDYIPDPANLSGDLGENLLSGTGKTVLWDAGAEGIDFEGDQYVLRIKAEEIAPSFRYVQGGTIYPAEGIYTDGLTVSSFIIGSCEITNADWNAVMGSGGGDNYPHADVSWFGAIEYCNRLSLQEGLTPCYSYLTYGTNPDEWPAGWNTNYQNETNMNCDFIATGYRLPTEAEWEYAARGGLQTHGYTYSGSNNLNEVGWYSGNSGFSAHIVGQLSDNELGAFDMSGNLWEWCWDSYDGYSRVFRGGCFANNASECAVTSMYLYGATQVYSGLGFRICRSLDNFVLVEGGTFNNGTSNVTVSSFKIDKFEITQAGYKAVIGINPSHTYGIGDTNPVYHVSWFNAIDYCNRRSIQEGLVPCYSYQSYGTNPDNWPADWESGLHTDISCNWTAAGYRLPTEMEWMFAAKGGNLSQGYIYSGSNNIDEVAWYQGNMYSPYGTKPVGTKTPNELGLHDMSGNVWEWVWDIYDSYPFSNQTNPTGPVNGLCRVGRSGGWDHPEGICTVTHRWDFSPLSNGGSLGFRIVKSVSLK